MGKSFYDSVSAALDGVVHTLISERNMRFHFLAAFLVLAAGAYFNLSGTEFMFLCFAVTLVLIAEMFNTAIEHAIDLISQEYHEKARIVKDIAAGCVFISAVNAALVGYFIAIRYLDADLERSFAAVRRTPWHITLLALLAVTGAVLAIKIKRKEKALLRGGMPSGHAALAFSVWVAVTLITADAVVSFLVFLLAFFIAKSRITSHVHSFWETLAGALIGLLITVGVFQFLF